MWSSLILRHTYGLVSLLHVTVIVLKAYIHDVENSKLLELTTDVHMKSDCLISIFTCNIPPNLVYLEFQNSETHKLDCNVVFQILDQN